MKKHVLKFIFLLVPSALWAQDSLHTELKELIIIDEKVVRNSQSQKILEFKNTDLQKSTSSFTDFLVFNTPIYFKENGAGMVSSPSFRGTTAQQTSVLWNGLRVNSLFLGQTDFNSISYQEYDQILIKPGGGSVLSGTSAIGGTIHLNNMLDFNPHFTQTFRFAYGSFDTYKINYSVSAARDRWNVQASLSRNESANDFEVKNRSWKNTNGAYENTSLNTVIGYQINSKNQISYISHYYSDDRHFSLISPYEIRTKYKNEAVRNLFQWKNNHKTIQNALQAGYVGEKYAYFDRLPSDQNTGGKVNTYSLKYDFDIKLPLNIVLSAVLDYQHSAAEGHGSGIHSPTQNIVSASLLGKQQLHKKLGYEVGIKQEKTTDYQNPLFFSAGLFWQPFSFYNIKMNASKNYRVPTFNDLFWEPGGNLQLKPETSIQFDFAHQIQIQKSTFNLNFYTISIEDMIRWLPSPSGYWVATNTDNVQIWGAEASGMQEWQWQTHRLNISANYAYTKSIDRETHKQLMYVPLHKINGTVRYAWKSFSVQFQGVFNGKVYTLANQDEKTALDAYGIINTQLGYSFGKKQQHFISFEIKNTTASVYENVENRPMPGRNYMIQLLTKF